MQIGKELLTSCIHKSFVGDIPRGHSQKCTVADNEIHSHLLYCAFSLLLTDHTYYYL